MKRTKLRIYKSSFLYSVLVTGGLLLGASSCTKNFERYNTDNTAVSVNLTSLMQHAQRAIYNFSGGGDPNSFQLQQNLAADCFSGYMMSPTAFNGGSNNLNYALVSGWTGEPFKVVYLDVLSYVHQVQQLGVDKDYPAVWAVAEIIRVAGMSRATDIYGPLPYSQAGSAKVDVPYDSQQDIYNRFFSELDDATAKLKSFISSGQQLPFNFATMDLVYSGDFTKWLQFANSLRLRLAMHIVKADAGTARTQAEKAMDPSAGGLITDNGSNMTVKISGVGFTNPLVFISQNWQDINISASLQTYLSGYNDPRIGKYLDKGLSSDINVAGKYVGIRIGSAVDKPKYVTYSTINFKDGASPSFTLTTPVQLMTAAEVYFLRAEAALRQWNTGGGTAQSLYEQGINTSLAQWGVSNANYMNDATSTPANYVDPKSAANNIDALSSITVKWNDAAANEEKLERIITQKWIAMFPEGQEAWTEFRRTGYPKLFPVVNNNSGNTIDTRIQIRRLPFTVNEYNTNRASVLQAVTLLGGPDNGGTRLWWDVNKANF